MAGEAKGRDSTKIINSASSGERRSIDLDTRGTQIRGTIVAQVTVVEGPGIGSALPVYKGDNAIGRDQQNRIALNFGDDTIHRQAHAWLIARDGSFTVEEGGKANPVYVNGEGLAGERLITLGDRLTVGSTTLRLDPK